MAKHHSESQHTMKSTNNNGAVNPALPPLNWDHINRQLILEKLKYGELEKLLSEYHSSTLIKWVPYSISQSNTSYGNLWHAKYQMAQNLIIPEVLIHDSHWVIRQALAMQGYEADACRKDRSKKVRRAAEKYLRETVWSKRLLNEKY